ncbi:MAG TPA: hypothetical protein VEQ66_00940 [Propionibacteriaceae bacterium]|nr:hypothetical protein [Propionibacteriaceae bacterium]
MSPGGDVRPSFPQLVDWVEGRLDQTTADGVSQAVVSGDPQTVAAVDWLREFLDLAQELPLHEPPPIINQNLRRYYARWSRARATLDHPRLELKASLLFDSRLDLAPVGVRGPSDSEGLVHLAYTTDRADLVLDVSRVGGHVVRLDGQVLLNDNAQAPIFEAVVTGPSGTKRTIDGDALGRFSLVDVPEDATELRVTNSDLAIKIALDLRTEDFGT